ncbi:ABC transporter substrate-binding protein [Cohnella hashimotonis]|uniref:Extracellular solute-binding protein n=1 Tax=Cohnella hashimotonis TaxID=2826895 RepID=A0ABT6THS1_9BACL|nr:extracellular solute-binding protein [Cohnella hashimotonis]MDI4646361.1 extracellular solute-binding protein [Cohnella hashimotonis]
MLALKKKGILLTSLMSMALAVSACGSNSNGNSASGSPSASASGNVSPSASSPASSSAAAPAGAKQKLTLMIAWPGDSIGQSEEKLVAEHFKDKYDITFKPVSDPEKTIKTTIASGNPVDLAFYWPGQMDTFVNADMALDLTPYLEANNGEWKNAFVDGALTKGIYNDKVYAVPITPVYYSMLANKDLLDQAGVTLPDYPTWDEFKTALTTIKEKLGIAPFGNSWASWTHRSFLQSIWPDDAKEHEWSQGQIPFTDPAVVKAFDEVKTLYDDGYMYPGKGALTVTQDQVLSGFKSGKVAIVAWINFLSDQAIKNSGLKNVQVVSWPHMGPRVKIPGDSNGYMIPANAKHPEASIEILKYLTSLEVAQHRVDNGSPVSIKGVTAADPNISKFGRDASKLYTEKEILTLSPKLNEYLDQKMPANYVFNPKSALAELEKLRLEAIKDKK